ncbi:MAG: redoxin domain-containing protein [Myxococcota bacterium]
MIGIWLTLLNAHAVYPIGVARCLAAIDVACAESVLTKLDAENSQDPGVAAALAQTRFHQGRYPEAHAAMKRAVDLGYPDRYEELPLFERTMYATAGWVEETDGRFTFRFRPGVDAMLWPDGIAAAKASDRYISPLLGGSPPGRTIIELYPDGRSFIASSSLKKEDVYTTGVVGLAKWGKLLVTSPRALPRGYSWQDTIAHEYIHLVVAHHTNDRAPVWLQEAIAKYLDGRWRDGSDRFRLSVRQQGLMADALESDDLVSFEEMHPSLAKLPSAERAALAYAQLATLMQFCFDRGGEDVLLRTLPAVAQDRDPRDALAAATGFATFDELEEAYKTWMKQQPLAGRTIAELPTVLDGGDDLDLDPLLAERKDLARFVTLGDILREAGRVRASLVEYRKAIPEDEPPSPLLSNRIAQAQLAIGEPDGALNVLERSLLDYPEFALSHKTLGELHLSAGRAQKAQRALTEAAAIHPFDPETQQLLVEAYRALGDEEGVRRHEKALQIRRRGGDDVDRAAIHDQQGTYELPSYGDAGPPRKKVRDEAVGKKAPDFNVIALDGALKSPSMYEGQVLILDFWATWCGPCREAMPELAKLYEAHDNDGLRIVGITDEPKGKVLNFLKSTPVPYTIALDPNRITAGSYNVTALPTVWVVDREGRVREVVVGGGPRAMDAIEKAVQDALAAE